MSSITLDATEITAWGTAMATVPDALRSELVTTTNELTRYGAGQARSLAPVESGDLRADIVPTPATFAGGSVRGSYGTDSILYAAIQEYGGTITPKRGKYLVFPGRNGGLVFARSVTIPAHPYMEPSAEMVRKRMHDAYGQAVRRALAKAGIAA